MQSSGRELAMPGHADHVLSGSLPGSKLDGWFVMFADSAELRSLATELTFTTERPWASNAVLIRSAQLAGPAAGERLDPPPEGYRVEQDGEWTLVWKAVPGNLVRTAEGCDLFCERAIAVAREARGR